jgi:hypothetical protein
MLQKEKSINEHFAKVQLYRWFQFYERELNTTRVDNQLDILADDIYIESPEIKTIGKENYPSRLLKYRYWKNAFHIKSIRVSDVELGKIHVDAEISYQNIQEFGQKSSYIVRYNTVLEQRTDDLPVFKEIKLEPILKTKLTFEDTYAHNRIKSLIHYFFGNLEKLDGNSEPFKEILTEDFEINSIRNGLVDSKEKFEYGLKENSKKFKQSSYTLKEYHIVNSENNNYTLNMNVHWDGIDAGGIKMSKRLNHKWQIIDDDTQRFAKIKHAVVEII